MGGGHPLTPSPGFAGYSPTSRGRVCTALHGTVELVTGASSGLGGHGRRGRAHCCRAGLPALVVFEGVKND